MIINIILIQRIFMLSTTGADPFKISSFKIVVDIDPFDWEVSCRSLS